MSLGLSVRLNTEFIGFLITYRPLAQYFSSAFLTQSFQLLYSCFAFLTQTEIFLSCVLHLSGTLECLCFTQHLIWGLALQQLLLSSSSLQFLEYRSCYLVGEWVFWLSVQKIGMRTKSRPNQRMNQTVFCSGRISNSVVGPLVILFRSADMCLK